MNIQLIESEFKTYLFIFYVFLLPKYIIFSRTYIVASQTKLETKKKDYFLNLLS